MDCESDFDRFRHRTALAAWSMDVSEESAAVGGSSADSVWGDRMVDMANRIAAEAASAESPFGRKFRTDATSFSFNIALGFAVFRKPLWSILILLSLPSMAAVAQQIEAPSVDTPPAAAPTETSDDSERVTEYQSPDKIAASAFEPPPSATPISKRNLWIDRQAKRVYCDGYVAMREGPLEMFACPAGTKEHESVVATIARSSEVHAALLAIGATKGTTVRFRPEYLPATGPRIRVWVAYRTDDQSFQCTDARQWIADGDGKPMDVDWVFAGSSEWTDPSDGVTYYQADAGDLICVSNFTTALMDVPVASSADASDLIYRPLTTAIPERGTPVRLILEPIEIPPTQPPAKPKADVLP